MQHERSTRQYKVTERELDAAVETYGSYDDAYRALGVTPDEVEFEEVPNIEVAQSELPPIAVSLGDRALALTDIMAYYNKANQLRGFTQRQSGVNMRHGRTTDTVAMQRRMEASLRQMLPQFQDGIATLVAADALRAHGYDDADIELFQHAMQAQLNRSFGPGQAYADDRREVVRKANSAA